MTQYREILRLYGLGISQHGIAESCSCSRNTVKKAVMAMKGVPGIMAELPQLTEAEVRARLFPNYGGEDMAMRGRPDLAHIDAELLKHGVNLKLLWMEYCAECRREGKLPLMYSQFCAVYSEHREAKRATMHIPRKPGEQTEVDWAGTPSHVTDRDTGEQIPAFIFVGVLSFSLYAYAEAFFSESLESWISAHVNMFGYFGGTTVILVPDNLKTGVDEPDRYDPKLNRAYREMAEHYGMAVLPARVRRPRDKPGAEGSVKFVTTWITAALRNSKFFSLHELNEAIKLKLEDLNGRPFQKKEGSRRDMFLLHEKPLLRPLPAARYELADWKQLTVQFNYHIAFEHMQYSVPYEYIHRKMDVRVTKDVVEVFCGGMRVCSHRRLYGAPNQYSTVAAHMPKDHREYVEWNGDRFVEWASKTGQNTKEVVKSILAASKIEQQAYRSCMGLLKLGDRHGRARLESACAAALSITPRPTYRMVKNLIAPPQGGDPGQSPETEEPETAPGNYGFVHGADYYGGKEND